MDVGLRTPLLDFFRKGDVARDVRLIAARGAIAPRPLEQLGILALLTTDTDAEIAGLAEKTLAAISATVLGAFIARSDVPLELRTFFERRGIVAITGAPAGDQPVLDQDDTDYGPEAVSDADKATTVERLAAMSVPQRVKAAIKGTREMRAILIRDPNKMVALAVLSSPKLTETEVESIARMGSVSEEVLRTIGHTRAWIKNYQVVSALVKNAKTPVAISLTLMQRLTDTDLRRLSTDRNVPEPLRLAARKRVVGSV